MHSFKQLYSSVLVYHISVLSSAVFGVYVLGAGGCWIPGCNPDGSSLDFSHFHTVEMKWKLATSMEYIYSITGNLLYDRPFKGYDDCTKNIIGRSVRGAL
jgi:hypothetical protein